MSRMIGIITANYRGGIPNELEAARPVASLPFLGRYRLVDFALSDMVNSGIDVVGLIMPVNYRSIIDHVGLGKDWGLDRKAGGLFIQPGSAFGASQQAPRFLLRDLLQNKEIFLRNNFDHVVFSSANIVCNTDFRDLMAAHERSGADITLYAQQARRDDPCVVALDVDGDRLKATRFGVMKGEMASLDMFVISRELLLSLLDAFEAVDYLDLFQALSGSYERFDVRIERFEGYAAPVFDDLTYYDANMEALWGNTVAELFPPERFILTKAHDTAPVKYEVSANVASSAIAAGCHIAGTVKGSILGRSVVVEQGAQVIDSIVMQGCHIGAGARVANAILDRNNVVESECTIAGTSEHVMIVPKPKVH